MLLSSAATHATEEARLLAAMKGACGGSAWDSVRSWHERSTVEITDGSLIENDVWHDMSSLKSAMTSASGGRTFRRTGYNAVYAWIIGTDGQIAVLEAEGDLRRQRRDVYLSSFGWFFPERFPARFELLPDIMRDDRLHKVLRITPADAEPFELWIDAEDLLVRRIIAEDEFADLSDYKTFDGVCTATLGHQGKQSTGVELVLRVRDVVTTERPHSAIFDPPIP
ncbi:MAG: hypothetical protein IBJ08_10015 [Pseudomonas sp.]|nr:hypothetical protein [Pseudomonas sp.]